MGFLTSAVSTSPLEIKTKKISLPVCPIIECHNGRGKPLPSIFYVYIVKAGTARFYNIHTKYMRAAEDYEVSRAIIEKRYAS
jgi:hypothetical protein